MTRDESAAILVSRVLEREGGIADVGDGKGVTRFGQTPQWLQQFGLDVPTTPGEARANYLTWLRKTGLLGVCDEPDLLADAVIDYAVHSGHPAAIKALQQAIGVKVDGVFGIETQVAVEHTERPRVGRRVLATRLRQQGRLITDAPNRYARYAAGWMNRLAEQVEAS